MVKPDIKHNYYADLELPVTASIDDIRKSYRKLALQYHPDRNAGREAECVPKFQAIQAANEVLGDPALKTKYDQDRRKAGLFATSKPGFNTPGNPYTTSSNYPPPPRRTQPGTWQRPNPPPPPEPAPSGADRFTNFPRPSNASPRKDPNSDRAQQFRAWQRMNNGAERPRSSYDERPPSPQPPPSAGRPRPQRQDTKMPSSEEIRAGMNYRPAPGATWNDGERRQSAWNAFKQTKSSEPGVKRSNTFRTPRKPGGFDPSTPGSDERPAPDAGSHYGHRHRSEDLGASVNGKSFPPPPPGPPPSQTPSRKPSVDASVPNSTANVHGHDEDSVPYYAKESRTSAPYSAVSGEKTRLSSENLQRSASFRDTTRLRPDDNVGSRARSTSPLGRQRAPDGSNFPRTPGVSSDQYHQQHQSSEPPVQEQSAPQQGPGMPTTGQKAPETSVFSGDRPKKTPVPRIRRYNSSSTSSTAPTDTNGVPENMPRTGEHPDMQQRPTSQNIFSYPIYADTSRNTANKSRSEENISTNFSPGGWSGAFTGSPDVSGRKPSPARRPGHKPLQRTPTGERSNSNASSFQNMPPPPRPSDLESNQAQAPQMPAPGEVKFSKAEWEKTFQDSSWTWPPPPPNPPPASRESAKPNGTDRKLRRQPTQDVGVKPAPQGSKENPHVVEEIYSGPSKPHVAHVEDDAMDIDSTPPPVTHAEAIAPDQPVPAQVVKEPRLYSVPPSSWRQKHGVEQQHEQDEQKAPNVRPPTAMPVDSGLNTKLDDLSRVEPLNNAAQGLSGFADMTSTLPFQSKAPTNLSSQHLEPQKLETPPVPKAPEAPHKLTKASFHAYCQAFGNYLQAFHAFNKTMLTHFEIREQAAQTQLLMGMSWLEAAGDTSGKNAAPSGFGLYIKGVREDEHVREVWNVGVERHTEAVKAFEAIRERMRYLASNNVLLEG